MVSAFTPFILTVLLVQWLLENAEPFVRRYAPVFQQAYADVRDAFLVSAGFGAFFYGWLMMRIYRARSLLFSARNRRHVRWRKQMAALLSFRYGLSPGGLGALAEDDVQFAFYLQRFLADHHVPYSLPLYDKQGNYLFASGSKIDVLATALVQAVGRGRDNELFVLLVDLLELHDRLEYLLRAVRLALSRHHQVVVVCPWPAGVPLSASFRPALATRQEGQENTLPVATSPKPTKHRLRSVLRQATQARLHTAYWRIRRAFGCLGVPILNVRSDDPVALILGRISRLRAQGEKR